VRGDVREKGGKDGGGGGGGVEGGGGQPRVHRPHRQFDREGGEKREPRPGLQAARETVTQERWNLGRSRVPGHTPDCEPDQDVTKETVEKELEAGIYAAGIRPTPHWPGQ